MKPDIFDTLPYVSREELIMLRNHCLQLSEENNDAIHKQDAEGLVHRIIDITKKFNFIINDVNFDKHKGQTLYKVSYNPGSLTNIDTVVIPLTFEEIKISLNKWIDNIRKMHAITEEYYNPDLKFYNEEFTDFFTNDDEDAAINPFELERQEVLYYFLDYAEKQISKSNSIEDDRKVELLQDIRTLKEGIPKLTKKKVVTALSKIAQKVKKGSNNLFHDVFDVLKKEAIKTILYYGIKHTPNALNNLRHWINLLH